MSETEVIILTENDALREKLKNLLNFPFVRLANPITVKEGSLQNTILLLDDDFAGNISTDENIRNIISEASVIYIAESIDSPIDYATMKSFTNDYIIKSQLTGSGLLNCIKYVEESRKLKNEIENQQKRYYSLFYNSLEAGFYINSEWEIENVNQAFINLFGLGISTHEKIPFVKLFRDREDYEHLLADLADGPGNLKREISFNRLNRSGKFPGLLKISAIREELSEKIVGFHGAIQNISYKKRLQIIKENSERLTLTHRLSRALAHEIRNPLTNISLATGQLEEELAGDDGQLYIDIIKRSTRLIDDLITRLMKSSEQQVFHFLKFDIIDIMRDVINQSSDRAKMKEIKLVPDFEESSLIYFCDPEKLQLAISNLVTNAIESIPEKKEGQVIIGQYEEDDYICLYVEDNGIGMNSDEKNKLFDPFFSKKRSGRGLGLTSVLSIISEHRGHIEVDSEIDLGTTFTIMLPKRHLINMTSASLKKEI